MHHETLRNGFLFGFVLFFLEGSKKSKPSSFLFFVFKIASLREDWKQAPLFYDWFLEYQAETFKSCLTLQKRAKLGRKGRYYNNALENRHKGQKKKANEEMRGSKPGLRKAIEILGKWVKENYVQEIGLAIRGLGKYRLAKEFQQLAVEPKVWFKLSPEAREKKIDRFMGFQSSGFDAYTKPSNAGKKGKSQKRRKDQIEPELFKDRVIASKVAPLKVKKASTSWQVIILNLI